MKNKQLEKLEYKSGFVNYGYKVDGGWEHTSPVNPDIKDVIIKHTAAFFEAD